MHKLLISSIILLVNCKLYSQCNGLILDYNGDPIVNVEIFIADLNLTIENNDQGEFTLDNDIPKNGLIHFYKHGYASKMIKYSGENKLLIKLDKLHVTIDEIGVSDTYNKLGDKKYVNIEKKSISPSLIENNTLLENITELNGVDMISSGNGIQKIVVRGLSGLRVVTYLNGMQINNQQWANDHGIGFSEIGLDEVELIKGSSALKYGSEAIGGLIYFKDQPFIKKNKPTGFLSTKLNANNHSNNSQFGTRLNIGEIFINLYAQNLIAGDYQMPDKTYLFNSRFKQNALKLSMSYKHKNLHTVLRYHLHNELTGIPGHVCVGDPKLQSLSELSYSKDFINFEENYNKKIPYQDIENQLYILESNYFLGSIHFNLLAGHYRNNLIEYGEKWTSPDFDMNLNNTLIHPNVKFSLEKYNFEFGSQINYLENINNVQNRLIPDANSLNIGPYAIFNYDNNNFGYNLGYRYDYKNLVSLDNTVTSDKKVFNTDYSNNFHSSSLSSGMFYKLNDHISRISYSEAYRAPHFSELFSNGVHHGTNRYEIGDENLSIEKSKQIDIKYQWSNDHFGVIVNPFLQNINNFISVVPTDSIYTEEDVNGNIITSYTVYNYIQYDNVTISGIEMNLHYHPHILHNLHFEQSLSLLKTQNNDDENGLSMTPANGINTKSSYEFDHSLMSIKKISLSHMYKFKQSSFSEYEEMTSSYSIINLGFGGQLNNKFNYFFMITNLLNKKYTPHTSRLRGVGENGVPNPGRSFGLNLNYEF